MTLCPKDATSSKYYFTSAAEWAAFSGGITTAVLHHLYNCQDAATGPAVDSLNSANLAGVSSNYQVAITGWSLKGLGWTDTGGASNFNNSHASLVDLHTTSQMSLSLLTMITSPPASERSVMLHGPGGTETDDIVLEYNSSNHYVITDGTNTGTGSTNHGTGVIPVTLRHDVTHSTQAAFIDYTPEKISKTFVLPSSGGASKGVWIGSAYAQTPTLNFLLHAVLTGSNAELSDAQVTALHARFNTGAVVSIAVTPSAPSLLVGATQQMTAVATFQDGSTLDVTSNANTVWTSSAPSTATISATGFLTAASIGTTTVTAAYGGVTSSSDLVSVIGITTPNKYTRMLMALLPPGKVWRLIGASVLFDVLAANADELGRLEDRTGDLLDEAIPSLAVELLPEYESELAIVPGSTDTNAQRQARIVSRLVSRQRYRPVDFQTALAPLLAQLPANVVVIERTAAYAASVGDPREIFRFFIYRDPTQPGTYFLADAQTLVNQIKPSHTIGTLIESINFLCDDPHSLCDRDLLGA